MDKEKEAFDSAIASVWGTPPLDLHQDAYRHLGLFWQAAGKWQRERDAEICDEIDIEYRADNNQFADHVAVGCGICREAILNQGSKE